MFIYLVHSSQGRPRTTYVQLYTVLRELRPTRTVERLKVKLYYCTHQRRRAEVERVQSTTKALCGACVHGRNRKGCAATRAATVSLSESVL